MKSIFVRILTGFVAVSFALIAAMSGIFTVAVSRSINEWNAGKRNDFVALILPAISKTYRLEGSLSSSSLENAVMPYTTDSLYIYIFDGNKKHGRFRPWPFNRSGNRNPPRRKNRSAKRNERKGRGVRVLCGDGVRREVGGKLCSY